MHSKSNPGVDNSSKKMGILPGAVSFTGRPRRFFRSAGILNYVVDYHASFSTMDNSNINLKCRLQYSSTYDLAEAKRVGRHILRLRNSPVNKQSF